MKKQLINLIFLAFSLATTSCGGKVTPVTPTHTHSYDAENIVWQWNKSSIGFTATASLTCKTCTSETEGHVLAIDADVSSFNEVEPTCTKSGIKKYKAEVVFDNKTYSNINQDFSRTLDPLGHEMEYTHDENKHYYLCVREGCGHIEYSENHDYSSWEVIKEADYGVDGLKKHHCQNEHCGYEEEEAIPAPAITVAVVQAAVDKANNELCPLTGYRIERAKYLYNLLGEEDKKLVVGYEDLESQLKAYNSTYDVVSDTVSKSNQVAPGTTLELITEKDTDKEYGNIEKAVSFNTTYDWVSLYFLDEKVDVSKYTKLSFYLYNPTASEIKLIIGDDNWESVTQNQKIPANSWGEVVLDMEIFEQSAPEGKLQKYFVGLEGYKGYTLGEKNIVKVSSLFGRKTSQSDVEETISLISQIKDDGSKSDAYRIYIADQKYNSLSKAGKEQVTNYDDLVAAKENALYGIASLFKPSQLQFTDGWSTSATLDEAEDQTQGHITKIDVNATNGGGVAEFKFRKVEDLSSFQSVSFAVYSDMNSKFTLSKNDWWKDAYDFASNSWKTSGDYVTFTLTAGWNELTISVDDFNQASYFSAFFTNGQHEFKITPAYGKFISEDDVDNVISLIDKIPSDVSKLQMKDTYDIATAKNAYDKLSSTAQAKVTNAQHLFDAINNCQYSMGSFCNASSLTLTTGWDANATVSNKVDTDKGHVSSLVVSEAGGALEYSFVKENLSSADAVVYFSVYVPIQTRFTLSKQVWWKDAYDFASNSWKATGDSVTYVANPGWNDLSLPLSDFLTINCFSFSMYDYKVGNEIMISAFYVK